MLNEPVVSLRAVLDRTDEAARRGESAGATIYPTGFDPLDSYLDGGIRAGELALLGGPQGLGKTTMALQMARNVAASGRYVLYFSFEHDEVNLLTRLVALETGLRDGPDAMSLRQVRQAIDATDMSVDGLTGRLAWLGDRGGAVDAVREYADRFVIHRSDGRSTSAEVVARVLSAFERPSGPQPFVVVDYIQKVAVPGGAPTEDERTTIVVEALKDLALEHGVPILAIVAADREGLAKGRIRIHHMRGSSALAYEADIVLVMNDKYDVVARHHLVYDVGNAERFRSWVVVSIEKNRSGVDRVDLEFRKALEHSRFDPDGALVNERLVDERVYVE